MKQPLPPHIFMATALISYKRDGVPKQRHMNALLTSTTKDVTYNTLEDARIACLQRLHEESNVPASDVIDYVILNMFYCGQMTLKSFQAEREKPVQKNALDLGKPNELN